MGTSFIPIPQTPEGVQQMLERSNTPLMLVSRHGLGDNIFFSPCFRPLQDLFGKLFFCSSVNAYSTIFQESDLVEVVYAGSINGADLGLSSVDGFSQHFQRLKLDLGVPEALVYHFGQFEPRLPYSDERAFVKGRRNYVELFDTAPPAVETPLYHVAPDEASRDYVARIVDRWRAGREVIAIGRYGHTDCDKNFGHDYRATMSVIELIERDCPNRFAFISLDYIPGDHAVDGRLRNVRSVYGFLPCDSAAMHHFLSKCRLLITVPSGQMLVGATIPGLKLLTIWKTMSPFHLLDPQFGPRNRVHAIVERPELADTHFMAGWPTASRDAVLRRWSIQVASVCPESVAKEALAMMEHI